MGISFHRNPSQLFPSADDFSEFTHLSQAETFLRGIAVESNRVRKTLTEADRCMFFFRSPETKSGRGVLESRDRKRLKFQPIIPLRSLCVETQQRIARKTFRRRSFCTTASARSSEAEFHAQLYSVPRRQNFRAFDLDRRFSIERSPRSGSYCFPDLRFPGPTSNVRGTRSPGNLSYGERDSREAKLSLLVDIPRNWSPIPTK